MNVRTKQTHTRNALLVSALLLFAGTTVVGCAPAPVVAQPPGQQVVVVHKRPPAPRREVRPRRPSRRHVWVGGHWRWRRGRYVWVRGYWQVPPRGRAHWVAAHWRRHRGDWVFVAGRWRR